MIYFVSRHAGAIEWVKNQNIHIDCFIEHLDLTNIHLTADDTVIGTLPVHIAAAVCATGARFYFLQVNAPFSERGKNLSADDMQKMNCSLRRFFVQDLGDLS